MPASAKCFREERKEEVSTIALIINIIIII